MNTKINRLFPSLATNKSKNNLPGDDNDKGKLLSPEIITAHTAEIPFNTPPAQGRADTEEQTTSSPFQNQIQMITPDDQPFASLPSNTVSETKDADILQNPQAGLSASRAGKLYPNMVSQGQTAADIQAQIQELGSADMGREHSLKNRLLSGLFKGVKAWSENGGQGGLAGLAGASLTGGVASAASPSFHGELRRNDLKNQLYGRLTQQQKQEEWQNNQEYKKAQTATIPIDDELKRQQIEDNRVAKAAAQQSKDRAEFFRQYKFFDPKNPTEAQKRHLARFGETPDSIGKYDFSKPEFKQIGDSTYKWNPAEQAFVDTNLPKNAPNAFKEVTLIDPDTKEKITFVTTQEKAGQMTNQRVIGNMQIEAAKDRQIMQLNQQQRQFDKKFALSKEQFEQSKKEFGSVMELRQKAFAAQEEARRINNAQDQQKWELEVKKYDAMIIKMQEVARKGLTSEELTEDQYNELESVINGLKR